MLHSCVYAEPGLEAIGNGLLQSLTSIVESVNALYPSNSCAYMEVKVNVLFHRRDRRFPAATIFIHFAGARSQSWRERLPSLRWYTPCERSGVNKTNCLIWSYSIRIY